MPRRSLTKRVEEAEQRVQGAVTKVLGFFNRMSALEVNVGSVTQENMRLREYIETVERRYNSELAALRAQLEGFAERLETFEADAEPADVLPEPTRRARYFEDHTGPARDWDKVTRDIVRDARPKLPRTDVEDTIEEVCTSLRKLVARLHA